MFWYIDRDTDAILITSEKWREKKVSLEHFTGEEKKKRKWWQAFSAFLDLFLDQDILGYIFLNSCVSSKGFVLVRLVWSGTLLSMGGIEQTSINIQNLTCLPSSKMFMSIIKIEKPCLACSSNVDATNVYNAACL